MQIEYTKGVSELCLRPKGRLDTVSAPELENFIYEHAVGVSALTLDLSELTYVSSAGLRVLLAAHKHMKGAMKIVNVCELVMEVLEMTGFVDILTVE